MTDADALLHACDDRVRTAGLQPVARLAHTFPGVKGMAGGVTATVLLAESHLCLHTWPELRAVTLDVYICNVSGDHSEKASTLMDALIALFAPARVERHALERGASVR